MGNGYTIAFIDSWHKEVKEGSGTAVAVSGLQKALRIEGHSVRIFSPNRLPTSATQLLLSRLRFNLRILPKLLRSQADIHVGVDLDGFLYSFLRPKHRLYFCCVKGIATDEARYETGFVQKLLKINGEIEKRNAQSSDIVVTTSRYCKKRIRELYGISPEKIAIVPEGIDLSLWRQKIKLYQNSSTRSPRPLTILCVARQYPRKRIELLLQAVASLRKKFPDLRLRIVGEGPEHARLRQLAKDLDLQGSLLGAPNNIFPEYAKADIFCLPSIQEGFGIVFLEAMASGLPIVAARSAAVPEVVSQGITGLLAKPDDAKSLAANLERLLRNPSLRQKMGAAGQKKVQHYDWKKIASQFSRLI